MTDQLVFDTIHRYFNERQEFALCTIIKQSGSTPRHLGSKMVVTADGTFTGSVGGGELEHRVIECALNCLAEKRSEILSYQLNSLENGDPGVCGGQVEIFVETIKLPTQIVIVGGGHVGKALVNLAKWLGFYVILSDDRPEFCDSSRIPGADQYILCPLAEIPNHISIDASTNLILTTRGVKIDVPGLPNILQSNAAYIGIIGSKRRWITTRGELIELGIGEEVLDKVHSPIGINVGAETPEEIALSIMAEVMILQKGKSGESMRLNLRK
ncbi:MAG TPA: XdhC/CoxI family protein [Anaerolineales bacterium]|nr:XdhC/CoxI family protein [Anaerolineales bacterium]